MRSCHPSEPMMSHECIQRVQRYTVTYDMGFGTGIYGADVLTIWWDVPWWRFWARKTVEPYDRIGRNVRNNMLVREVRQLDAWLTGGNTPMWEPASTEDTT